MTQRTRIVITSGVPPGTTVIGRPTAMVSLRAPIGNREINVQTQFWPSGLPSPWGASGSGRLSIRVLDLLRCTTRYFFVESWLARRPDGWVLAIPVVEYAANTTELRWQRRNANVARWLSEMAGVGLSCHVMELCGATSIGIGNAGRSGPDYHCRMAVSGRETETWFESKGSSTKAGVTAQILRATQQVSPYKRAGSGTLGLICATCIPTITSKDVPCIYLVDPPTEDRPEVAPFQRELATLAATLGWAGELDAAFELASTVMSLNEGTADYLPADRVESHLSENLPRVSEALVRPAEVGVQHTMLVDEQGGTLSVTVPPDNIRDLWRRCRDGIRAVSEYRIERIKRSDAERWDHASIAPDGSAMVWRPSNDNREKE